VKKKRPNKKPSGPLRIRFKFSDGTFAEMPLADYEEHLLRQQHALASSDSPANRRIGDELIRREAERRGGEKVIAAKRKQASERGAKRRRQIGRKSARRVQKALAAGVDPAVSDRQLRRIKSRRNRRK
jgi:hypothetical protein